MLLFITVQSTVPVISERTINCPTKNCLHSIWPIGPKGSRGTAEAGAAVACQPGAPAAPLPFTAPHMVLQRQVPRGLLAPHHPGLGPATRPLSPPVSPLYQGLTSPLSPLYPLSLCAAPLHSSSSPFDCLDHVSI
ncbi:unnamed protein product [Pleuronectes platessa]|uniref:Uncharacterized protein n=1 Tax=Pleuronectes platessa TaxID=8262 RepID=A0A9N7YFA1_PLEPL|nr:unnamed protein product [Pleuronectes platessa]